MSREIDQKVVEMQFINGDFEKKARQSIETLQELRNELDLEGAGEAFGKLSDYATNNNASFKKLSKSGTTLSKTVKNIGSFSKKAFSVVSWPLKQLGEGFKTLNGYIGKYLGFNIAGKLVNTAESIARAFTIDPISQGWQQYQQLMDSTRTIMSGTKKTFVAKQQKANADYQYNEEQHMEYVNQQLNVMREYAKSTSYALSDMTNNIGKFTNAGVELEDATMAMIGIANATAYAGQGAQQAQMAYYNLGQAMGVGKLTTIDYKSLENANIMTAELKELFIELGGAMGTLEKQEITDKKTGEKTYKYLTKKSAEHKKQVEVTAESMRETLSYGWATADVMTAVFSILGGKYNNDENGWGALKAATGLTEQEAKAALQLYESAKNAAKEVRTLSKMMDALKESVQSGWSDTWQLIFGNMTESTGFFTRMSDRLSSWLDSSADFRNNMLEGWRGRYKNEKGEWVQKEGAIDGREILMSTFDDLLDIIDVIRKAFSDVWNNIFGEMTSERLLSITQSFHDIVHNVKEFVTNGVNLENVKNILAGIGTFLKNVFNTAKRLLGLGWNALQPIFDFLGSLLGDVGKALTKWFSGDLIDFFNRIKTAVKSITKEKLANWFSNVGQKISNLWSSIKTGVHGFFTNNGLDGVWTFLVSIKEHIATAWHNFTSLPFIQSLAHFLRSSWDYIVSLFKGSVTKDPVSGEEEAKKAPVVQFLENIVSYVTSAYQGITKFFEGDDWKNIKKWVSDNLFQPIASIFEVKTDQNGKKIEDAPVVVFFRSVVSFIDSAFKDIQTSIEGFFGENGGFTSVKNFIINNLVNPVTNWFKPQETTNEDGEKLIEKSPAITFFESVKTFFENTFNTVKTAIEGFFASDGAFSQVKSWIIKNLVDPVTDWFSPTIITNKDGEDLLGDSPAITFFNSVVTFITKTANDIKTTVDDFFKEGGTFSTIIGWIRNNLYKPVASWFETKTDENGETLEDAPIVKFFKDVRDFVTSGLTSIYNEIQGFFNGETWSNIKEWVAINLWDPLQALFNGKEPDNNAPNAEDAPLVKFFTSLVRVLGDAWTIVTTKIPWGEIGKFFSNIWYGIVDVIHQMTNGSEEVAKSDLSPKEEKELTESTSLFERILGAISGLISTIYNSVSFILEKVGNETGLSSIFEHIGNIFENVLLIIEKVTDFIVRLTNGDNTAIWTAIGGFIVILGDKIINIIKLSKMTGLAKRTGVSFDSIADKILKIAGSIALIALAMSFISSLNEEELLKAAAGVMVIGSVIAGLIVTFNTTSHDTTQVKSTAEVWSGVVGKLVTWVGVIGALAVVMALLPNIINALDGKQIPKDAFTDIAKGFAIVLGGIVLVTAVMAKFNVGMFQSIWASVGFAIALGSAIITLFVAFLTIDALFTGAGHLGGDFFNSGVVKTIAGALGLGDKLAEMNKNIAEKYDGNFMYQVIDNVADVLERIGNAFGRFGGGLAAGFTKSLVSAGQSFSEMAEGTSGIDFTAFGVFISNLSTFLSTLLQVGVVDLIDKERISKIGSELDTLSDFLISIGVKLNDDVVKNLDLSALHKVSKLLRDYSNAIAPLLEAGNGGVQSMFDLVSGNYTHLYQGKYYDNESFYQEGIFERLFNSIFIMATRMHELYGPLGDPVVKSLDFTVLEKFINLLRNMAEVAKAYAIISKYQGTFNDADNDHMFEAMINSTIRMLRTLDDGDLEDITNGVDNLATTLNQAFIQAADKIDTNPLISAICEKIASEDSRERVTAAFRSLADFLYQSGQLENPTESIDAITMLFGALGGKDGLLNNETLQNLTGEGGVVDKIAEAFDVEGIQSKINSMTENLETKLDFSNFTLAGSEAGKKIIDGMDEFLKNYDGQITATISPVIGNEDLAMLLDGVTVNVAGTVSIEQLSLLPVTNAINDGTNKLANRLDGVAYRISQLEYAIRDMRVILDTGVIAGAVDERLGRQSAFNMRWLNTSKV